MRSQFYARSHALICTCPKNGVPAPHSTSSPHLAQTEQVRLMRFFALPDSNTSPRVTISVLGHVVVSQMGIVQVPYATVTVKYFRALSYGLYSYGLSGLPCMPVGCDQVRHFQITKLHSFLEYLKGGYPFAP